MTRESAQRAIDDGFADGLKRLFSVLVSNLGAGEKDALAKFQRGLANHDEAHSAASGIIEKIFEAAA